MKIKGNQLKLKESLILDIIKNCLTKHSITVHEAIIGERKFTEALYEKLKYLEVVLYKDERFKKKNSELLHLK